MKIKFIGHSCFFIEDQLKIITDPFDNSLHYKFPKIKVDVVLESHQHFDHNAHNRVDGDFTLLKEAKILKINNHTFEGLKSYHDKMSGKERGENIIFKVENNEGISWAHFGDIGDIPSEDMVQKLEDIDIAFIPVGGKYTLENMDLKILIQKINPKIIIPMHYKTQYIDFPIKGPKEFADFINWDIDFVDELILDKNSIGKYIKKYCIINI